MIRELTYNELMELNLKLGNRIPTKPPCFKAWKCTECNLTLSEETHFVLHECIEGVKYD